MLNAAHLDLQMQVCLVFRLSNARDASLLLTFFTHEKFYSTRVDDGDIVTSQITWFGL